MNARVGLDRDLDRLNTSTPVAFCLDAKLRLTGVIAWQQLMRLEVGVLSIAVPELNRAVVHRELRLSASVRERDGPAPPVAIAEIEGAVLEADPASSVFATVQDAVAIAVARRIVADLACVGNTIAVAISLSAFPLAGIEDPVPITVETRVPTDIERIGHAVSIAIGSAAAELELGLARIENAVAVAVRLAAGQADLAEVKHAVAIAVDGGILHDLAPVRDTVAIAVGARFDQVGHTVLVAVVWKRQTSAA
jgi:hypothetical protein